MNKKQTLLNALYQAYTPCTICPIDALGSSNMVHGTGNPNATLMFVGEAPGEEEDRLGLPFVGRSGKLLTTALTKAGLNRDDVFITNVLKCRPPNNRAPFPEEMAAAREHILSKEIQIIHPTIICTLGASATMTVLEKPIKITQVRGMPYLKEWYLVIPN